MTRLFAGTPFDIPPTCDDCGKLMTACECTAAHKAEAESKRQRLKNLLSPSEQTARIQVQKRKGARLVTVVEGLTAKANDLSELLSQLQAACGTGGTAKAKEDLIELQGNHSAKARQTLAALGYRVR